MDPGEYRRCEKAMIKARQHPKAVFDLAHTESDPAYD
jgi:hypothetical protein